MPVELIGPSDDDEPVPIPLELDVAEDSDESDPDLFRALAPILGKGCWRQDVLRAGEGMGQDLNDSWNSMMLTTCCIPENSKYTFYRAAVFS